jgi:hypothetical protein
MKQFLTTKRTFALVLFLGLLAMTARNVIDPDVWWHLKTGEYIAQHQAVPHTDPFSFTRAGQPWVAHEWLSELLFYEVFRIAGFGGLILLAAAVLCAAFFLLYLRSGGRPYIAGIVSLAGVWATAPLGGVRPQMLSLLLASLWLLLLERSERNPWVLFWTLPITLLWVNLHAGFALGLALSFLFLLGDLIERMLGAPTATGARWRILALTLLLDLPLVRANPNGARMYFYPIETLHSRAMQTFIVEWLSPNFHRAEYLPFLFLLLAALAFLGASHSIRPRDLLLLIVGTYAALCSIRMIPLFVLIVVPLLSKELEICVAGKLEDPPSTKLSNPTFLNVTIVLAMAAFVVFHLTNLVRHQAGAESSHFPTEATAFLQTHPPGRLFNDYDWGGYLIWRVSSTPVFVDGRADLYGDQFLQRLSDTYQLKNSWHQTLDDWKIQTVIVPPDSALATGLQLAPDWRVAYRDREAIVLTFMLPSDLRGRAASPAAVLK